MKTRILSDLHLEFGERSFDFSDAELLIFAGDINIGTKGIEWLLNLNLSIPIIYVLGNHEFYKNSYPKIINKIADIASGTNVHVLENNSIIINNITFHGTTLWTDFELFGNPKIAGYECQQKMSDFKKIKLDNVYSKINSLDLHIIHKKSLVWLKESLKNSQTSKNVVISHHAPSINSIPFEDRNNIIASAYTSNLEDLILETQPDYWIHGHIHKASDYMIGKTRVLCNPVGYPEEKEICYKSNFIVDL